MKLRKASTADLEGATADVRVTLQQFLLPILSDLSHCCFCFMQDIEEGDLTKIQIHVLV